MSFHRKWFRFWSKVMLLVLALTCLMAWLLAPAAGLDRGTALYYQVGFAVSVWLFGLLAAYVLIPKGR